MARVIKTQPERPFFEMLTFVFTIGNYEVEGVLSIANSSTRGHREHLAPVSSVSRPSNLGLEDR
jgi:hypothetical protein